MTAKTQLYRHGGNFTGTLQLDGIDVVSKVLYDAKGDLIVGTGNDTAAKLTVGSNGQLPLADSSQSTGLRWATLSPRIGATIDGAGVVLTTGAKAAYVSIPYDCTITAWRLLADVSGSVVVDVWKDTFANFPPTNADSIVASAKPTLTTALAAESSTLTGWTTSCTAGDVLEFEVESATSVTRVRVELLLVPR